VDVPGLADAEELERFRNIRWLHNHWSRPMSPRAYYWYLTFEHCPELHALVEHCQAAIDFPYYDLSSARDLHLTLDRVAFDKDISADVLRDIEAAALHACQHVHAFDITIGPLAGTRGALGFTASPASEIAGLRDTLRSATLSAYPDAPVRSSDFHPHVAIAYANADNVPAGDVIAAVERLNAAASVDLTMPISSGALVLLERRPRAYAWQAVARIPLGS
jgi:2'-5' RNA ligase